MTLDKPIFEFLKLCCSENNSNYSNYSNTLSSPGLLHSPVSSEFGKGSRRVVNLGNGAVILITDCCLVKNYRYTIHHPQLLCISCFQEIHGNGCHPHTLRPLKSDTCYAHFGLSGTFQTNYKECMPLRAVHILLMPHYYQSWLPSRFPGCHFPLEDTVPLFNGEDETPDLAFIFYQILNYQDSRPASMLFYESKLNELLSRMLLELHANQEATHRHVKDADFDAVQLVAEHICAHPEHDVSIASLAQMACMSPAKLKYVFKSVFSCSIREYRLNYRMQIAKDLLLQSDLGIAEIAFRLGYQTSSSFSELFKKYTGLSPKSYRLCSHRHSLKK